MRMYIYLGRYCPIDECKVLTSFKFFRYVTKSWDIVFDIGENYEGRIYLRVTTITVSGTYKYMNTVHCT
jgi:hypothetical protein